MADDREPNPRDDLSDRITQLLVLELLKAENSKNKDDKDKDKDKDKEKPTWLKILDSAGFVALVTVLIGGLIGSGLTVWLQSIAKEKELAAAAAESQKQREIADFTRHLDREREIINDLSRELGVYIDASEDLVQLSRTEWNTRARRHDRLKIVEKYNAAGALWSSDRVRLSLLLQLENNNDPELRTAFQQISDSADVFARCADRWRTRYTDLSPVAAQKGCQEFRQKLEGAMSDFTGRLAILRTSAVTFPRNSATRRH